MTSDFQISNKVVVGTRETIKAVEEKNVIRIFLAKDCDGHLKDKIMEVARAYNIPLKIINSKLALGRVCGIDVAAATAAILK